MLLEERPTPLDGEREREAEDEEHDVDFVRCRGNAYCEHTDVVEGTAACEWCGAGGEGCRSSEGGAMLNHPPPGRPRLGGCAVVAMMLVRFRVWGV